MLSKLLVPSHIRCNVEAGSWEDAVRSAGNILVEAKCVEQSYVEQMIAISEEAGPYIVIVPGVALAHARPEDGVNELSMSLVLLKEPVYFGNEDNDPVRVVVALAARDDSNHLEALRELVLLINSPENINQLCCCTTGDEAAALIEKAEIVR